MNLLNYVKLPNAIVIQTPSGPIHRSNRQFNYQSILHLVVSGGDLSDLEPLLVDPPTPDGLFYAYMNKSGTFIYVEQHHDNQIKKHILPEEAPIQAYSDYLGVYTSLQDIAETYPEIFI